MRYADREPTTAGGNNIRGNATLFIFRESKPENRDSESTHLPVEVDYYALLEISNTAIPEVVTKSYRRLAVTSTPR